ncbi:hypothetical protein TcCL_NonESM12932 [Trypanosoma cruzi]|nr:hypothetical protein TcCL_NonESM12932 [Trypanosoma cruzi]
MSLLLLFPLLRPSQARHAHFNTRPSSTGLGIVGPSHQTQPSCAPAAPQRTPPPPSVQQLRVRHFTHDRRNATAAQHAQGHMQCRAAIHVAPQDIAMRTAQTRRQQEERDAYKNIPQPFTSLFPSGLASHTHSEARRTPSAPLRAHSADRRSVTHVPSQRGAQKIVVADHRCL